MANRHRYFLLSLSLSLSLSTLLFRVGEVFLNFFPPRRPFGSFSLAIGPSERIGLTFKWIRPLSLSLSLSLFDPSSPLPRVVCWDRMNNGGLSADFFLLRVSVQKKLVSGFFFK